MTVDTLSTHTDTLGSSEPQVLEGTRMTAITESIRTKVLSIINEQTTAHKERDELVRGMWTAILAKQHLLMLSKPGAGKSHLGRELGERIRRADGSRSAFYETELDESTTPDQLCGVTDVPAMIEKGVSRRNTVGTLVEAEFALMDEFFNGPLPTLHHIMPLMNEGIYKNGEREPIKVPRRTYLLATNKTNTENDFAAVWDRVHWRFEVDYVEDRDARRDLIRDSLRRRLTSSEAPTLTTITLEELDQAHDEAMQLEITDKVNDAFFDLLDELKRSGVEVSTRREVDITAAVLANAWLNGHEKVKIGDLSVLRHMCWSRREDIKTVKAIVLSATNPGEKRALELLDDVQVFRKELDSIQSLDEAKRHLGGMNIYKKLVIISDEAAGLIQSIGEEGNTTRLGDVVKACADMQNAIAMDMGLKPEHVVPALTLKV